MAQKEFVMGENGGPRWLVRTNVPGLGLRVRS